MKPHLPTTIALLLLLTPTALADSPLPPKPKAQGPKPKAPPKPRVSECCFSRDKSRIQKTIRKRIKGVQRCYESALKWAGPGAGGKVVVAWTITPSGKVQKARIESSTMGLPKVETCIREAIEAIDFGPADEACPVTFPFVFKSAE